MRALPGTSSIRKLENNKILVNDGITIEFLLGDALQMEHCVVGQAFQSKADPAFAEAFGEGLDEQIASFERDEH